MHRDCYEPGSGFMYKYTHGIVSDGCRRKEGTQLNGDYREVYADFARLKIIQTTACSGKVTRCGPRHPLNN